MKGILMEGLLKLLMMIVLVAVVVVVVVDETLILSEGLFVWRLELLCRL